MNFWFEMAINAVEITLIFELLGAVFRLPHGRSGEIHMDGTLWRAVLRQCSLFLLGQLYEGYASLVQILINIAFCCILLRGSILQKIFVSAFTMGLVAVIATFTALLVAKLSGNNVTLLLSRFNSVRIISILITKLLFLLSRGLSCG